MTTPTRLAQYVQPNLPEARVAHQWARISYARRSTGWQIPTRLPAFALALIAACAIAVVFYKYGSRPSSPIAGILVESGKVGVQSLTLPDGSHIELTDDARLQVNELGATRVQMTLLGGHAQFRVAHEPRRAFVVVAGRYEVSVVGTQFTVTVASGATSAPVAVHVDQGKVTVRERSSAHDARTLSAGESWSDGSADSSESPTNDIGANQASNPRASLPASNSTEPSNDVSATPVTPVNAASAANQSPKELFELAETLRLGSKYRESADTFNKLRRKYRSDPRAGLSAFELGLIRMDIFGDVAGSIEALRDAIQLSPNATFHEDAQARIVQLYQRQGNLGACRTAKAEYLTRFPRGAASKVVNQLCEH